MTDGGAESKYETSGRLLRILISLPHFYRYSQQQQQQKAVWL